MIIGINVEKYIEETINAIKNVSYPQSKIKIIYVDGGSTDNSVNIVNSFNHVHIISLKDRHPTPGKGRNAGWRYAQAPFIQFLDGDCAIAPDWLQTAISVFEKNKVVAVFGTRKERYPNKNLYHFVADVEWGKGSGEAPFFGGGVLVKSSVFQDVGGYDEYLVAGEDPEFSYRIRQKGYLIYQLPSLMETHDINMSAFYQYWKRSYRSGHAFAEVALRYIQMQEKMWLKECIRICLGVLLTICLVILSCIFSKLLLIVAIIFACRNVIFFRKFKKRFELSNIKAFWYSCHVSIVIYPQFCGIIRYMCTIIFGNALKNTTKLP